jgi:hypothetical protein
MDGHGFDELTKALSITMSRRVALKAVGGGFLGRLLSLFGGHYPRGFERCHNLCGLGGLVLQ